MPSAARTGRPMTRRSEFAPCALRLVGPTNRPSRSTKPYFLDIIKLPQPVQGHAQIRQPVHKGSVAQQTLHFARLFRRPACLCSRPRDRAAASLQEWSEFEEWSGAIGQRCVSARSLSSGSSDASIVKVTWCRLNSRAFLARAHFLSIIYLRSVAL